MYFNDVLQKIRYIYFTLLRDLHEPLNGNILCYRYYWMLNWVNRNRRMGLGERSSTSSFIWIFKLINHLVVHLNVANPFAQEIKISLWAILILCCFLLTNLSRCSIRSVTISRAFSDHTVIKMQSMKNSAKTVSMGKLTHHSWTNLLILQEAQERYLIRYRMRCWLLSIELTDSCSLNIDCKHTQNWGSEWRWGAKKGERFTIQK